MRYEMNSYNIILIWFALHQKEITPPQGHEGLWHLTLEVQVHPRIVHTRVKQADITDAPYAFTVHIFIMLCCCAVQQSTWDCRAKEISLSSKINTFRSEWYDV
jgi:hypothetical protein